MKLDNKNAKRKKKAKQRQAKRKKEKHLSIYFLLLIGKKIQEEKQTGKIFEEKSCRVTKNKTIPNAYRTFILIFLINASDDNDDSSLVIFYRCKVDQSVLFE